jgi:hypothetical protein
MSATMAFPWILLIRRYDVMISSFIIPCYASDYLRSPWNTEYFRVANTQQNHSFAAQLRVIPSRGLWFARDGEWQFQIRLGSYSSSPL